MGSQGWTGQAWGSPPNGPPGVRPVELACSGSAAATEGSGVPIMLSSRIYVNTRIFVIFCVQHTYLCRLRSHGEYMMGLRLTRPQILLLSLILNHGLGS